MANITEVSEFTAAVPELDTSTPALGGPGGVMNSQAQALANRTKYLKDERDKETVAGRALVEAANAAAQRTALGLGDSATLAVGTGAGDVAAGNAPAGAVTTHESTYAHTNLPTADEKSALTADYANLNKIVPMQAALAQAERDINELERTIQQGQGATIDIDDYGIVSLDARATGRANPTIEGRTAVNLVVNGDASNGTNNWSLYFPTNITLSVVSGKFELAASASAYNFYYNQINQAISFKTGDKIFVKLWCDIGASDALASMETIDGGYSHKALENGYNITIFTVNHTDAAGIFCITNQTPGTTIKVTDIIMANLTAIYGAGNEPSEADCAKIFSYFAGTDSVALPARIRCESEDDTEDTTLYISDTADLRSVPAIQDEVEIVNGELVMTQNVSTPVAVLSGVAVNTTNYPTAKNAGKWVNELTAGGTEVGTVGTDSTAGAGQLRFELATPIITTLQTSGALQAKRNGTVYFEPWYEGSHQTNAGGEITLPFGGTIEKVYGYDESMVEYELDPSEYALVGTTLTITGAVANEVFYVELSRSEPLAPLMNVNVLNNLVVPTTVNAETYTVLDGDHTLLVAYSATGACAITIPSALIAKYIRLVIKDSGGSANTNNITISTEGTEKIDGADTYVINAAKGSVELASDGANLFVVG